MDGGQNIAWRGRAERKQISPRLAAGLTLLSVVLWGFSPIGTRYMVGLDHAALPAVAFSGVRYGLAALLLVPVGLRGLQGWSRRDWGWAALCGVLGVTGYNLPTALGQRTVSAGLTGLLDGAEPLMIVLFSALQLRQAPGGSTMLATAIGLAGILLLAAGGGPVLGDPAGIALVLLGAVLWAGYCVLVPPLINQQGALSVTAVCGVFGAVPMLAAGAPQTPHMLAVMSTAQWEVMLGLVAGASVGAMLCWNAGSAVLGAAKAGWFLYLLPLVSVIGGAILLGEPIKLMEMVGGGLVLFAVFVSQK